MVQVDDEYGRQIADRARRTDLPMVTVDTCGEMDYRLADYEPVFPPGGRVQLRTAPGEVMVEPVLPGWHNMMNATVTVAMLERAGILAGTTLPGLVRTQVPGRVQMPPSPKRALTVIVDFVHASQVAMAILDVVQEFGEMTTVAGCGGGRDPNKRPLMGRTTAERSDVLTTTGDSPRIGDPARIRVAMLARIGGSHARVIEAGGRGSVIELAPATAGRDSVTAILGERREQSQQTGGRIAASDDVLIVLEAWRRMGGSGR